MDHSSIDPEEIRRFEAMADSWWDPTGPFKPLHKLNPVRLQFIREQVAAHWNRDSISLKPLSGLELLDIGCGGGLSCEPVRRLGALVTGIDPSTLNIGTAKVHAQQMELDIDYRATTAEALADAGMQFDVVLNLEVVEHVADVQAFMNACGQLLKPGGVMICGTLNRTVKSLLLAKIGAEYLLRWLPAGTHNWRKFLTPAELSHHLREAGLSVTMLQGISYEPLRGRWALSHDLDVNYMAVAVKAA